MELPDSSCQTQPAPGDCFGRQNRARFLSRATLAILGAVATTGQAAKAGPASDAAPSFRWKGKQNPKLKRWDIITIGNLSRNRYWGESDSQAVRAAICTCTVVQGEGFRLIVDPSLARAEQMTFELDRRTGLKPRDLDAVFITHEHGDHWAGLAHFPEAKWFAAADVAAALNKTGKLSKAVEPAASWLFSAVEIIPTPGHTMSHHSLRFDCEGLSVLLAGDAVATRDFWGERRGYYNCVDFELSRQSMDKIARLADIVVPGHDNLFLNLSTDA
jgi:glyoxylase-like metal-dependent hydrolase (beta-lactamase superfamily II)